MRLPANWVNSWKPKLQRGLSSRFSYQLLVGAVFLYSIIKVSGFLLVSLLFSKLLIIYMFLSISDHSNDQNIPSTPLPLPQTGIGSIKYLFSSEEKQPIQKNKQIAKRGKDKTPRKKGEAHGNWKGGDSRTRDYDSLKYNAWKEAVLKRYNFRCIVTGATKDLACHHLNSWDWCVEGRYDALNGVVLTKEIHNKFHKIYGQGQNTIEQFQLFLSTNFNIAIDLQQHGNHEPSLTTEQMQELQQTRAARLHKELVILIKSRQHELISGVYENASSPINIRCLIHGKTYLTTATNYKRCKTGLSCCGKVNQSIATAFYNTLRPSQKKEEEEL